MAGLFGAVSVACTASTRVALLLSFGIGAAVRECPRGGDEVKFMCTSLSLAMERDRETCAG